MPPSCCINANGSRPLTPQSPQGQSALTPASDVLPSQQVSADIPIPNVTRKISVRRLFARLTLLLGVVLPAILSAYYFAAVASDQYETETRMVVRTIGLQMQPGSDRDEGRVTMLGGAAVVQDAHIVVNYLKSVDIVEDLQAQLDLRSLFSDPEIDMLSRLEENASSEELFQYWLRQSSAYVDGPSGIIEFKVRAFTPDDAVLISEAAVERVAQVIETLSEQAKQDLLVRSKEELDKALDAYVKSLDALRKLQNSAGILDPLTEAGVSTELITTLFMEKLQAEAELATLQASGVTNSPVVSQLRNQAASLEGQIEEQRKKMAGVQQNAGELSAFFAEMNALETDRLLAESLYQSASRSYDLAKSTTQRQSTFVSVFAEPITPNVPTYPKRFPYWAIFVTYSLAIWATFVLIWAAIDDHRN